VNSVLLLLDVRELRVAISPDMVEPEKHLDLPLEPGVKLLDRPWGVAVTPGVVGVLAALGRHPLDPAKLVDDVRLSGILSLVIGVIAKYPILRGRQYFL